MKNTAKATGMQGRIVNLSSIAHSHCYKNGIRFEKISDKAGYANILNNIALVFHNQLMIVLFFSFSYNDKRAYGQSKLANVLHANELSRRLQVKLESDASV